MESLGGVGMSIALASVASVNHNAPSLKGQVERILDDATADGSGESHGLQSGNALARQAFLERQPNALEEAHQVLRRLYDLQLAPVHAPEAEHQYNTQLMAVRVELERAWIQSELASVSPQSIVPGEAASAIRSAWKAHPSFDHPIFDFMEFGASREQIALYFICDYALNMRFYDLIALACLGVDEEARCEVAANLWDEVGRGERSRTHVTLYRNVLDQIGSSGDREDYLAMLGWEGLAGYNLLMHLALARRQHFRYIGALAITELSDPNQYAKLLRGCTRAGIGMDAPGVLDYYQEHVTVDALHGEGWIEHVIEPAIRDHPTHSSEIMEGAILRMNSTLRYWDWLLNKMKSITS